jgi:CRISPR-associated protein Csm4
MALAPCAFDPQAVDALHCYWLPVTRFGRHGGVAALGGAGGPFKRPLMLARTGAVVTCRTPSSALFQGCGLGGSEQPLSGVIPGTVHQGYAPVIALNLETHP